MGFKFGPYSPFQGISEALLGIFLEIEAGCVCVCGGGLIRAKGKVLLCTCVCSRQEQIQEAMAKKDAAVDWAVP